MRDERVWLFDPETAEFEERGRSLGEWARLILEDYEYRTGYPLAQDRQVENGPLAAGRRLMPRRPFVLGGEFTADNLAEIDELKTMRARAELARQIRDLPDGAEIRFDGGLAGRAAAGRAILSTIGSARNT